MDIDTYLQRWAWRARQISVGLGLPSLAALVVLACCIIFYFFVSSPAQKRIDLLRSEAAILHVSTRAMPSDEQKKSNPVDQLAEFYQFFPEQKTAPDWMAKIVSAAAGENLMLEQGEYKLVSDGDGRLARYEMTFPIKGGYISIRKFIARAMDTVPNLSLSGISFSRQKAEDTSVEAQVRFVLHVRKQ